MTVEYIIDLSLIPATTSPSLSPRHTIIGFSSSGNSMIYLKLPIRSLLALDGMPSKDGFLNTSTPCSSSSSSGISFISDSELAVTVTGN